MKPDRPIGDNMVDDVEMERFVDWLLLHGHTPFSMSEQQLQEIWFLGVSAYHLKRCQFGHLDSAQYDHHMSHARQAQGMLCSLEKQACPDCHGTGVILKPGLSESYDGMTGTEYHHTPCHCRSSVSP
jgi:hypothetical protein